MNGEEIVRTIELVVALLAIAALVAIAARPLRVPDTVALVLVGLAIGLVASWIGVAGRLELPPQVVLLVLLPGLVFEAAYRLRLVELRRWSGALLLLAIPGVLVTAVIVAGALVIGASLPIELAFLVGAMVSATDPAAVVATFKRLPVSPSLATIVDGESLLNDGTGLVLFAIAVTAISRPVSIGEGIATFAIAVLVSVAIGLAVGWVAARLLTLVDDHRIELTISVVVAYGSYLVADAFHLSGVLATVTAAIVLGNVGPGRVFSAAGTDAIDTVWEFLAYVLTAIVFLLVGLVIPPAGLLGDLGPVAWVIGGTLVARFVVVYGLVGAVSRVVPPRLGFAGPVPRPWLDVLAWSGLRGAVAVAMALALPADVPQRALLQELVFAVVLFTLLVQATTIGRLVVRAEDDPFALGGAAAGAGAGGASGGPGGPGD
jgi:CPA1 family monovalent cation:H+ antiporter